jgi:thiol-disulfide isomerase/thioredoxin
MDAGAVVIPSALIITIAAGRGRRDPSLDLELAAAAYAPFFAIRAVYRAADLDALFGPLPPMVNRVATALGLVATGVTVAVAIGIARRRPRRERAGSPPALEPEPLSPTPTRARVAATALAAVLGLAFATNAAWVVRHGDAIAPLRRGSEAPAFALPRIEDGATFDLRSLRGRIVLLDFWATWCPPCVQMIPTLHALHEEWSPRGVELVGINSDGAMSDADELRAFLREHPAPYPMLVDDGRAAKLYRVVSLPHLVLLDRDGGVLKTFWGYTRKSELDAALDAALKATH